MHTFPFFNPLEAPQFTFQNQELEKLHKPAYTKAELETIFLKLVKKRSLFIRHFPSGGTPAVSVDSSHDYRSLANALSGKLINCWARDAGLQGIAELYAGGLPPKWRNLLGIKQDAWKQGLLFWLKYFTKRPENGNRDRNIYRVLNVIHDKVSGRDMGSGWHIRIDPVAGAELDETWGHRQNDALAFINFLTFFALEQGKLDWNDTEMGTMPQTFACLLIRFWEYVHVWEDHDLGAWEDFSAEHADSIYAVAVSLALLQKFIVKNGPLSFHFEELSYDVTYERVSALLQKCKQKLHEVLPAGFIRSQDGSHRVADAAVINALLIDELAGTEIVSDEKKLEIIKNTERYLMGHIGFRRYLHDLWNGRFNDHSLKAGQEAQWCHVAPMLSVIYASMCERTKNREFAHLATFYFNRALAQVTAHWTIPEAYIIDPNDNNPDPHARRWIEDENDPLAWAQAMTLLAGIFMMQTVSSTDDSSVDFTPDAEDLVPHVEDPHPGDVTPWSDSETPSEEHIRGYLNQPATESDAEQLP